jgi:hypothetical protein
MPNRPFAGLGLARGAGFDQGILEKLLGDGSPQFTPQLEVHRLTEADPDAALALLQKLLPEAQLTLDAKTNSLMALAVPADQQVIRSTLEQLQAAANSPWTHRSCGFIRCPENRPKI